MATNKHCEVPFKIKPTHPPPLLSLPVWAPSIHDAWESPGVQMRQWKNVRPVQPCCHSFTTSSAGGGRRRTRIPGAVCCGCTSTSERRRAHLAACEQETYERSACEHNDERLPACRRWEVNGVWEGRGLVCRLHACVLRSCVWVLRGCWPPERKSSVWLFVFFRSFVLCYFHTRALALFRWLCLSRLAVRRAARRETVSQLLSFQKLSFLNVRKPSERKSLENTSAFICK